jgi:riboflavin kinase/FMN adenylyltransferase
MADHSEIRRHGLHDGQRRLASEIEDTETRLLIEGRVRLGDQRGRTIGFPTANVPVARNSIQPPTGVFAGYVHVKDGASYEAAVSVGTRQTFYEAGELLVEAHLLDFVGELYGKLVVVELVSHLRGQVTFSGLKELKRQLRRDVRDARTALTSRRPRLSSLAA